MELQDALNENESLKASISKLREEINEKRKELQVEKELRISAVQDARADERANAKLELQELRQKLTSEKSKEIAGVREELRLKTKMELDTLQEIKEREVSSFQKKLAEAEKGQRSAEQEVEKIRKAQASKSDTDLKKLHRSLFEIQEARDELKTKFDAISAADKEKAELIRQLKENHEKEMKKQSQESRQASKKQMEEMKELQKKLSQKEKEFVALSEKTSRLEMEKDQLEDKLHTIKEAEAWEKMSPRNSIQGEPFSPFGRRYSEQEKETLVRNSELSYLSRTLQEKNKALETERNEMRERAETAELQNKPLQEKVEKLLKKIDHLTAVKSSFEKKIATLNTENIDLKSSKQEMEGEMDRQKRNFQRQLTDSRAHSHSVTQMRSENLALQEKLAEQAAVNDKLKATNQRRTKELGRLRKKLVKMNEEAMTQSLDSQSETFEDDEADSISVESTDQGQVLGNVGSTKPEPEPLVDPHREELERKVEELQVEIASLKVCAEERDDLKSKLQEIQERHDELEAFIVDQDVVKRMMKEKYESELDTSRRELFDLQQVLESERNKMNEKETGNERIGEEEGGEEEEGEREKEKEEERLAVVEDGETEDEGEEEEDEEEEDEEEEDEEEEDEEEEEQLQLQQKDNADDGEREKDSDRDTSVSLTADELASMKAQLEDLKNSLDDRDKRIKVLEHTILLNRAQLKKAGVSETALISADPDDLTDTLTQLEDSEQQLKEIYAELLDKPLYLAEENQRLEEELHQAKEVEEELSDRVEELDSELAAAQEKRDELNRELSEVHEWVDENQAAAFERNNLREELVNAKNRIQDLEEMQEELLKQTEGESLSPTSAASKPPSFPRRSESTIKRKTGAKAIERSIDVVETVQGTVLKLREKLLSMNQGKEDVDFEPQTMERKDQGTGPEEVVEEVVEMTLGTDVEAEIDVLTTLLQDGLGSLNELKKEVEENERNQIVSEDPIEEQLRKVEEEKNALLAELNAMQGIEEADGLTSSTSGLPSEYENPSALRSRKLPHAAGDEEDYDHEYSELELRRRESGVYEPVGYSGRKRAKPSSSKTPDDTAIPGEETSVDIIPEETKPPVTAWNQEVRELQKELQELQKCLTEQKKELEDFQVREDELQHQLEVLQPENEELKQRVVALTEDELTLSSDIEAYEKQLKEYKQELNTIKENMATTGEEQDMLRNEKKQLSRLLSEKEEELEDLTNVVPRLHKRMSQLEEEQEKWKEQCFRLEEQLSSIDGGRERDLKEEVEEWRERYQNLTEKIDKDLLAKLQSRMADLQQVLEEKDRQISILQTKRAESTRRKKASRVFVALFDYCPSILCHTGHPDKELEFKEGDILEVVGDLDAGGFYRATLNGATGLVPANFVEEVDISDSSLRQRLYSQHLGQVDHNFLRSTVSPVSLVEDIVDEEEDIDGSPFSPLNGHASFSKPHPPKQIKVEDKYGASTMLSWQPPIMTPAGHINGREVIGYYITVNRGRELFVKGFSTSCVTLKGMDIKSISKVKICTATKDGGRSDWVNVSVATPATSPRAPLSPPPLSSSYGQSSLYDSLKLGQSAVSPMNSFGSNQIDLPESDNLYTVSYDYEPSTTPGESSTDELPLKAGTVAKLLEEVREDGLVKAEVNGKIGLVPFSFLEKRVSKSTSKSRLKPMTSGPSASVLPWESKREVMAMYNYNPVEDSPNVDGDRELPFRKGQRITLYGDMDSSGFYLGASEGKQGLVPSNFVQEITGAR